jgi:DNA-directed RNA polymerase specialized sigma24 family protein
MNEEQLAEMERIDQVVFAYQAGDRKAGEEILSLFGCHPGQKDFESYIGKYYKLLKFGKINFNDRDTRHFIRLFMSDVEARKAMIPWYQYAPTTKAARKSIQTVSNMLRTMENDDFEQDLRVLLLQQAKRYKKMSKKIFFTGYLYNSYRYELKRHIEKLTKRKDVFKPLDMQRAPEDVAGGPENLLDLDSIVLEDTPTIQEDDVLGNSWVRGLTCGEAFRQLTSLQRLIIKLHYEDGYTDGEIGKKLNMHINTIHRHRKKSTLMIESRRKELIQEGYYE